LVNFLGRRASKDDALFFFNTKDREQAVWCSSLRWTSESSTRRLCPTYTRWAGFPNLGPSQSSSDLVSITCFVGTDCPTDWRLFALHWKSSLHLQHPEECLHTFFALSKHRRLLKRKKLPDRRPFFTQTTKRGVCVCVCEASVSSGRKDLLRGLFFKIQHLIMVITRVDSLWCQRSACSLCSSPMYSTSWNSSSPSLLLPCSFRTLLAPVWDLIESKVCLCLSVLYCIHFGKAYCTTLYLYVCIRIYTPNLRLVQYFDKSHQTTVKHSRVSVIIDDSDRTLSLVGKAFCLYIHTYYPVWPCCIYTVYMYIINIRIHT
jgi:hypothetical protein